jgi:tetratricopeptide (TPR) repeat protein
MNLAQIREAIARGDRQEAAKSLLAFEQAYGSSSATHELRGSIAAKDGDRELAFAEFRRAVELDSTNWSALASLGLLEIELGDSDGLKRINLAIDSSQPSESLLLKRVEALRVLNRHGDARVQVRELLRQFPESFPGWRTLAAMEEAASNRRLLCAALEQVCRLAPNDRAALLALARCYADLGRWESATSVVRGLLQAAPADTEAKQLLVRLLLDSCEGGRLRVVHPRDVRACYQEAMDIAADLVCQEGSAENLQLLGQTKQTRGLAHEAISCFQHSLEVENRSETWEQLGVVQLEVGSINNALDSFSKSIDISPQSARPHFLQAMNDKKPLNPYEIERLHCLLAVSKFPRDQVLLNFALAKRYEQAGDFDSAWLHYTAANSLKPQGRPEPRRAWEQAYRTVFSKQRIAELSQAGAHLDRPVFIVGMPRSGTTLVEQILSSHSRVFGAGELHDITYHAESLVASASPKEALESLDAASIQQMARDYEETLDSLDLAAERVIDKMPTNFAHLGLIACMFPRARIIHCKRDPLDTCLSCLTRNLDWPFCNMTSLGDYYRGYLQTMTLWRERLDLEMLEVRYESLVSDVEQQSQRLVGFLQLRWESECLDFHRSDRPVRTPSRSQVRSPVYGSSVGAWKRYATHLQPLVAALDLPFVTQAWQSEIS